MSIYEKSVRAILPEMIADLSPDKAHVFSRDDALKWFGDRYPKIKEGTITAHLFRFSVNAPSRLHYQLKEGEDLLFKIDGSHFRRYDPSTDPAPIHGPKDIQQTNLMAPMADEGEQVLTSEFAYERDLNNYLSKNLSIIESGLRLYEDEGITGVEFPAGSRFIDILALNKQNHLVVIELKVSRGYDRVVGQLLRYMGWIRKHHAEKDQQVYGIIVAREISDDLKLACSELNNVRLLEYDLSVKVRHVALSKPS